MSSGRESTTAASRWPELATLRALARDAAEQLQLPRVAGGMSSASAAGREPTKTRQPAVGRRGRDDHVHGHGKNAKVMHLLLWGPK